MSKNKFVRSPIHYVGNKFRLLSQLFPHFPKYIDNFYEPFVGSATIPLNITARQYHLNDKNSYVIELHEYINSYNDIEDFIDIIEKEIYDRGLSQTNAEAYLKLRNDYNTEKTPILFFLLICYTFNNQIRFNSKEQFNSPFGLNRSSFNTSIKDNLIIYHKEFKNKQVKFYNKEFDDFLSNISFLENDFVYLDPPYLISNATYNGECKKGGWGKKEENSLYEILDNISHKVKFMLSNVYENKDMTNDILIQWSKKYNVSFLNYDYNNSYASRKKGVKKSVEVIVKNY